MALDQIDVSKPAKTKGKEMSFLEHLEELRWHLMRAVLSIIVFGTLVFIAKDFIFDTILFAPRYDSFFTYQAICRLSEVVGFEKLCFYPPEFSLITPQFGELFLTHIKVSVILGFVLSFPYILWEAWKFIKPGLYTKERKVTRGVVLICSLLFTLGLLFGYFVISPFAVTFLAGYQISGIEQATPALASYINYMIMFTVPAGLIFELPVMVYFLAKVGLVTADFMRSYRRHAFVILLLLAAIVTPPDVITQFLIGIPLFILYEVSIYIAKRVEKKHEMEFAASDPITPAKQ